MKLLIFAGGTRAQSYNRQLAKVAADMARQAGAEVTLLELSGLDIPLYNADLGGAATICPGPGGQCLRCGGSTAA
jgi:NAD(P)H-dependent FMN reductase